MLQEMSLEEVIQTVSEVLADSSFKAGEEGLQQGKREQILLQKKASLHQFSERIGRSFDVIIPVLESLATFKPEIITQGLLAEIYTLKANHTELEKWALVSLIVEDQDANPVELFTISAQMKFVLYLASVELYNLGRYEDAADAFSLLVLLDPTHYDAWIGLGSSDFFCGRYSAALIAYARAVFANPSKPESHLFSAHCFERLKQYEHALNSLDIALYVMGDIAEFQDKVSKAKEHKSALEALA